MMRNPDRPLPGQSLSSPLGAVLILLVVFTFTQAQSLYEMLAGNREFLALRLESNWQLMEIVLVFNLQPVLVLFALWWVLSRVHLAAARAFLTFACFLAFLTFFFQLDNAFFLRYWKGIPHSYWLWLIPALALSVALVRFEERSYTLVRALTPIVLLFPLLFLVRTWTGTDTYIPSSVDAAQSTGATAQARELPPIVVLVLDELSLPALLDGTGDIDPARFPTLRALAQQSYWFRNATANADHTTRSVPGLLTGNLPLTTGDPSYRVYPENLFTWLQSRYQIYVWETWTHFCVPRVFHCMGALHEYTAGRADLYSDILALYAERVLPGGIGTGFQSDSRTWALLRDPHRLMKLRLEQFEKLMRTVDNLPADQSFLVFFHHDLPHSPYWLSPDGDLHESKPGKFDPGLRGNAGALAEVLEHYRQQISFVDGELDRLFLALKSRRLYDKSLLIVTSDHGVSYRAEAPGRNLVEEGGRVTNGDLLLSVPLLIKLPGQRQGQVSDADVQLIDLVPTLSDVLGLETPWPAAGRSVFGQRQPSRTKIALDGGGHRHEFPPDLGLQALSYRLPEVTPSRAQTAPAH